MIYKDIGKKKKRSPDFSFDKLLRTLTLGSTPPREVNPKD